MEIGFSRYFKRKEVTVIGNFIKHELEKFQLDLDWLDSQISNVVLFEFYKENLAVFMFPNEENLLEFSDSQALAFLEVFGAYDELFLQSICQSVIENAQRKGLAE